MQVAKWGNSLAVRIPAAVVEALDAMIAAAAVHADCDILWSEDMQHGMMIGEALRIVNPFRGPG